MGGVWKTGPIWRLYFACVVCSLICVVCYILYFTTWHLPYLGIGSAALLVTVICRAAVPYFVLIEDLRYGLGHLGKGDLDFRLYSPDLGQASSLVLAFNEAAEALEKQNRKLVLTIGEQNAVLSSMAEGVIAVDSEERIIRMNGAACAFMQVSEEEAVGRDIQEVIRNSEILRFVENAHLSREPIEADIILRDFGERILHAYGKTLRDSKWNAIGVLVVFSDITRLRHLENVRRDFVANVSHELRTPITSIKGFIETLADGAIDNPADARRFLDILIRQADRLNAIFEDLLTLSRIEEGSNDADMRLEPGKISTVIKAAIEVCAQRATERSINIVSDLKSDPLIKLNQNLLEQAVSNLLDNAIKYSEEGSTVKLQVQEEGAEVCLSVRDQGPGIDKTHLPRIFERFYRVDKARTRKAGGTGLGLAIVKHIAECHRGRASVESSPGQGSTFSLYFPIHHDAIQASVH